jgi:hypothetical protein
LDCWFGGDENEEEINVAINAHDRLNEEKKNIFLTL